MKTVAPLRCSSGSESMLPDERTTHSNDLSLPSEVDGLVVAPGRAVARALVDFLRGQGINVRTVTDGNAAFEEALLHPPDVVLIDDRVPPAGGIDLCSGSRRTSARTSSRRSSARCDDLRAYRVRAFDGRRRCRLRPVHRRAGTARAPVGAATHARAVPPRSTASSARRRARSSIAGTGCRTFCTTSRGRWRRCRRNVDYLAKFGRRARRCAPRGLRRQPRGRARRVRAAQGQRPHRHRLRPLRERPARPARTSGSCCATPPPRCSTTLRRLAALTERTLAFAVGAPAGRHEPSLYGDRELIASRDPEPGDGRPAPRRAARRCRSTSSRPTRHAVSLRRARRAAAGRRAAARSSSPTAATPRARRRTGWAWRWRGPCRAPSAARSGSRICRRRRLRVRVRAGLETHAGRAKAVERRPRRETIASRTRRRCWACCCWRLRGGPSCDAGRRT